MKVVILILIVFVFSSKSHAIVKECSTYPLITYPERATLKKHVSINSKPFYQWGKLTTKQRIEICRALAKSLRKQ